MPRYKVTYAREVTYTKIFTTEVEEDNLDFAEQEAYDLARNGPGEGEGWEFGPEQDSNDYHCCGYRLDPSAYLSENGIPPEEAMVGIAESTRTIHIYPAKKPAKEFPGEREGWEGWRVKVHKPGKIKVGPAQ